MDVLNPHQWEQPEGGTPSCGNRTDLFKKQRRHIWLDAGTDVRHMGDGSYGMARVRICARCGKDAYSKADA